MLDAGDAVLGVGADLVHVPAFTEQFDLSGSTFSGAFSPRELRRAVARAEQKGDSQAHHLAAVWALKEAVLKAWLGALDSAGTPAPLEPDLVRWDQIEVHHLPSGAPQVRLRAEMLAAFEASVGPAAEHGWHVSASHDGDCALGFAVLTRHLPHSGEGGDPRTPRERP